MWGGLLARMFVELYPAEVVGLVYIDPTDVRSLAYEVEYCREQGYVGAAMVERNASLLRFRDADRGEFKVLVDTVQSDFKDFRSLQPLPDVPMAVFMSASSNLSPGGRVRARHESAKRRSSSGASSGCET